MRRDAGAQIMLTFNAALVIIDSFEDSVAREVFIRLLLICIDDPVYTPFPDCSTSALGFVFRLLNVIPI